MNRREFLRTGTSAAALLVAAPAWCAESPKQTIGDAEILGESRRRIEQHRKGEGSITVLNPKGRPVAGAKVTVEQLRHDFLFGCNLFGFGRCGDREREEKYRGHFSALLNYCTLGFYWASYEPERGKPNYEYTDGVVEWTRSRRIRCKGHPLVWDHPAGSPRWLPDDLQQIQELSNARVREIVSRFKGRIDVWDVVNEATHLPDKVNTTKMAELGLSLGPARFVSEPLKVARAAHPQALLVVNDYRTDPHYYELLKKVGEQGKSLFDIIGIQSHMHGGVWPPHHTWEICDRYSKLGRPIHFTETTIVSGPRKNSAWADTTPEGEARQAEHVVDFYRTLFAHPAVQAITWWDFSDYHAWQGAAAGFLRKDMSPKPVYERLMSLIKGEWWTRTEGRTGPLGNFTTRAFYGAHRITVEAPSSPLATREVNWRRGQPNHFVFRMQV